jgi:prepilin-type N-terminal cleavage/methylation domain-containing protein
MHFENSLMAILNPNCGCRAESRKRGERLRAFTLIELLVVTAIIAVLSSLLAPALSSIGSANNFSQGVGTIAQTLEEARAYAVSKRTYVYAGVGNFKSTAPKDEGQTGSGRVALFVAASRDGARIAGADYATLAAPVSGLVRIENLQINDDSSSLGPIGGLNRRTNASVKKLTSLTANGPLPFPLGGQASYNFASWVLEFSPNGMVQLAGSDELPGFIEFGLVPTHGDDTFQTPNVAVIQVSGLTGKTTIYRP